MSESESADVETVEGTKHENSPRKRVRHRKKQLYENILKQMEFYFSDANLNKDRLLGDLIKKDPFVPLDIFLKCNKIRAMTQDGNDIVKAMKNSTLLELSEDKTKVKRQTPILPYNADERTVYVESIPVTASREWLERVFSDYGRVAYISLPKFKNSQRIKGYGFIEFHKPEEAQKCISTFTKMGCKLPTCMPPEELSSIKMFSVEAPQDAPDEKEFEPPKKKTKKNREKKTQKNLELKLELDSDHEKALETPTKEDTSITTPTEENKQLDSESKDELTSQDESKEDQSPRKKKTRKRTAKERSRAKKISNRNEAPKGALWGLQVLPKSEWKVLRNKYLNLQKKYMKDLKASIQNNRHLYSSIPPAVGVESVLGSAEEKAAALEKVPGVYVRDELPEPCFDIRAAKRTIRSNIHVSHVEVKEGQTEAIIRFDTPKAAEEYCRLSNSGAIVLTGAEEEEQWSRAASARAGKRARGRTRVLARASVPPPAPATPASPQPTHTHIRFDE